MINFELDSTQLEILELAKSFAKNTIEPAERELDQISNPTEIFKSEIFKTVFKKSYELGFHKMNLPENYGGLGLDPITVGLIWEEFAVKGAGITATLISAGTVPGIILFLAGHNKNLINKFVIPYCQDTTGSHISAWGSSEPNIGSDGCNYYDKTIRHQTSAKSNNQGFILNGTKSDFISNGSIANVYLVFANVIPELGIRGSGAFIVPADFEGVSNGRVLDKIGLRALNQSALFLDKVQIPEEYMIFPPGDGYIMLHNSIHTVGNIGVGYLALGLMRAAYEEALNYSKTRIQGGMPIFKQQLVAKSLFDAYSQIEAIRSMLLRASYESKKSFPGNLKLSLACKVHATTQSLKTILQMQEILGGYGISKEYKIEKYVRDATLLQVMDGANGILSLKGAALL